MRALRGRKYNSRMTRSVASTLGTTLAVDIGATAIKFGLVDDSGQLLDDVLRLPTPYPCSPSRLVDVVAHQIALSRCSRVGVGFPGEFKDGRVIEPGNLSRVGGITTEIDPLVHQQWQGFDLQAALHVACRQEVRVVNDATLAALGCSEGHGTEIVFTLGTGFGIALVVDGTIRRIRDVGAEVFLEGRTYDQVLGESARSIDEHRWSTLLHAAVRSFVAEFDAETVHFGGGNARRVDPAWFEDLERRVVINSNDITLRGVVRLFEQ